MKACGNFVLRGHTALDLQTFNLEATNLLDHSMPKLMFHETMKLCLQNADIEFGTGGASRGEGYNRLPPLSVAS